MAQSLSSRISLLGFQHGWRRDLHRGPEPGPVARPRALLEDGREPPAGAREPRTPRLRWRRRPTRCAPGDDEHGRERLRGPAQHRGQRGAPVCRRRSARRARHPLSDRPPRRRSGFPAREEALVRPFETFHRVPSQDYTARERRHRLREEFRNLDGPRLGALRKAGAELDETYDVPLLAFSGDTRVEVLERTRSFSAPRPWCSRRPSSTSVYP